MKPSATLRALLAEAIDYAGLFPPAKLRMSDAVRLYAEYLDGRDAWALGRFVLPAARLDDFSDAWRVVRGQERPWRLSAVLGGDALADCASIRRFNAAHGANACIDSIEMKLADSASLARQQITSVAQVMRDARIFAEVPAARSASALLDEVAAGDVSAKIRTGGIIADAFPSSDDVVSLLLGCAERSVSFKATAGLHHPCRGNYPLTYDADAPQGTMFGFLNVLLAAIFAAAGVDRDKLGAVLEVENADEFWFGAEEIRWRDLRVSRAQVQESRTEFVLSFGSCSFEEPIQDLRALTLL